MNKWIELGLSKSCPVCAEFYINDVKAEVEDFGSLINDEEKVEQSDFEYGCFFTFIKKSPRKEILDKYNINLGEYEHIAEELQKELSIGFCFECA